MTEKKPVTLVVSDIDNTISEYFNNQGTAWGMGIERLAQSRGMETDELYKNIRENAGGYARFHNFPDLLKETPALSLEGKSAEERKRLEKIDAQICHDVSKQYHEGNKLYEGALATIRKAKAAGAKFVMYTDSQASGAIARLADMNFPIDLIDGLVCRADCTCVADEQTGAFKFKKAPMQVTGQNYSKYRDELVEKLGDNLVINSGDVWKPNMQVMQSIIQRHGSTPEQTVMVGDNIRSDGGIVRMGVNFAWQKQGAEVSEEAKKTYAGLNDNGGYVIGQKAQEESLKKMSAEDPVLGQQYQAHMVTLEGGFKDLNKHFAFRSAEKTAEKVFLQSKIKGQEEKQGAAKAAIQAKLAGRNGR